MDAAVPLDRMNLGRQKSRNPTPLGSWVPSGVPLGNCHILHIGMRTPEECDEPRYRWSGKFGAD